MIALNSANVQFLLCTIQVIGNQIGKANKVGHFPGAVVGQGDEAYRVFFASIKTFFWNIFLDVANCCKQIKSN